MELIFSFITTVILLLVFYHQDRNKEPLTVLIEAFLIGIAGYDVDWNPDTRTWKVETNA